MALPTPSTTPNAAQVATVTPRMPKKTPRWIGFVLLSVGLGGGDLPVEPDGEPVAAEADGQVVGLAGQHHDARHLEPGTMRPYAYLDNAATTQKPRRVIDSVTHFYEHDCANVHRGVHLLSQRATIAYESARTTIKNHLGAADSREIVFTRGTTESINLVANSFVRPRLSSGDEVLITGMEHHSNIVPWQLLAERTGATLRWFPVTDNGRLDESGLTDLVNERTKIVSLVHMSNILGTVNATSRITARVREVGALLLLDCSQSVPHMPIDVVDLESGEILLITDAYSKCAGLAWFD